MSRLYSVFAIVLPVSLGLGLIYLCVMGRIEPLSALLAIAAVALAVPLAMTGARVLRSN